MSSVIFYRFYSNNPALKSSDQYISFQGTGITVFELKREIILQNSLGDGSHFILKVYNDPDTADTAKLEEISEDNTLTPPDISAESLRWGAAGSFQGNSSAASGGQDISEADEKARIKAAEEAYEKNMNEVRNNPNLTESEKMTKLMEIEQAKWEQQQEALSKVKNVYMPGAGNNGNKRKHANSGNPPPAGYICYGCGSKDHWLQDCPTAAANNSNGSSVDKAEKEQMLQEMQKFNKIEGGNLQKTDPSKMTMEELATTKLLIDENGNFVKQVEDKKSWEMFVRNQFMKNKSNQTDAVYNKGYFTNLPRNLECALTEGLLKDPVKTQCCNELVSSQAMEDKLIENDFVCPLCGEPDCYIDTLEKDEETAKKVDEFLKTLKK
ncbi:unnamed protein product [Hanseniaspora opuntiae]